MWIKKYPGGGTESEDFIVEEGSSANWYYRKWDSGFVELYCEYTFESGAWLGASPLYYGPEATVTLPFTLKKAYVCKWNVISGSGAIVIPDMEQVRNLNTAFAGFSRVYGGNHSVKITCQISVKGSIK